MGSLFDQTFDVLSKSLDMHLLRHEVITDNIANAETPHFKARRVDFEAELQKAVDANDMGVGNASGIASIQPRVYEDEQSELGQDLNTVDMDREMAAMTKNEIQYTAAKEAVAKKFALLRYAISEGSDR